MDDIAFETARARIVQAGEKRNSLRLAWYQALICDPLVNARGAHPVAWLLADLLGKNEGYAYPTIGYLAAHLKRPEITIRKAIHQLERREWILISRAKGTTNRYVINPFKSLAHRASIQQKPRSEEIEVHGGIEHEPRSEEIEGAIPGDRRPRSDGIAVPLLPPSIHPLEASESQVEPDADRGDLASAEMARQGNPKQEMPCLSSIDGGAKGQDVTIDYVDMTDVDPVEKVFIAAADPEWQIMEEYATALSIEPRKPFEFEAGNGWYFSRQDVKNARRSTTPAGGTPNNSCEDGPTTRIPELPAFLDRRQKPEVAA